MFASVVPALNPTLQISSLCSQLIHAGCHSEVTEQVSTQTSFWKVVINIRLNRKNKTTTTATKPAYIWPYWRHKKKWQFPMVQMNIDLDAFISKEINSFLKRASFSPVKISHLQAEVNDPELEPLTTV